MARGWEINVLMLFFGGRIYQKLFIYVYGGAWFCVCGNDGFLRWLYWLQISGYSSTFSVWNRGVQCCSKNLG